MAGAPALRSFRRADEPAVVALWNRCGLTRPWNDPSTDIARKVAHDGDLFLVAVVDDRITGSVMAGYDGHRGWINYLAVDPDHRGAGVGRLLMAEAERRLRRLGCAKINLQVRRGNDAAVAFYDALGYTTDDVTSLGKRLVDDDHRRWTGLGPPDTLTGMPPSTSRPEGAPQVLPYLYYPDAAAALRFLVDAFGFSEIEALRDADGQVWSAQLSTGDGVVLLGPGMAEFGTRSVPDPTSVTSRTFVYVDDVDAHCRRARAAGATIVSDLADHGPNRIYVAGDCGGQQWIFATPVLAS